MRIIGNICWLLLSNVESITNDKENNNERSNEKQILWCAATNNWSCDEEFGDTTTLSFSGLVVAPIVADGRLVKK